MALGFADSAALAVVLRAGVCDPDVVARGARVGAATGGGLALVPDRALPAACLERLRAVGVDVAADPPVTARAVRCWAEAVAPVRVAEPARPPVVIFVAARPDGLLALAAELVRLGCDRLEVLAARGAVRAVDPPTYTTLRARDGEAGLRAFAPAIVGQDRLWIELGYHHPLLDAVVRAPDDGGGDALVLVGGDGAWRDLPRDGWRGLDAVIELGVSAEAPAHAAAAFTRRRVELRLARGRPAPASLWVLRADGEAGLDRLLAYLPEEVVARLAFAATAGPAPLIVLRARTGRGAAPELSLPGAEAYAPLAEMPDVYAPADARVEPPLRRERLRAALGVAAGEVAWLADAGAGAIRVERIADAAFAPLAAWTDYLIHAAGPALTPWRRATELDFAPYVQARAEAPPPRVSVEAPPRAPAAPAAPASPSVPARATPRSRARGAVAPVEAPPRAPVVVAVDADLARLEAEFVALDAPADAPARLGLLRQLGVAYAASGQRREAGLCFARVAWEARPATAELAAWLAAELGGVTPAAAYARALAAPAPSPEDARRVALLAASGAAPVAADPHAAQRWLDQHDAALDARTQWLARVGLAALVGGDALGLARAGDRVLARLIGGLPVERELPAFLRFGGRAGALGAATGDHLRAALDAIGARVAKTKRKRHPLEAAPALTGAYVTLVLAHGYARVATPERAQAGLADARAGLGDAISDPVHAYLVAAFAARIAQVIAGAPLGAPLPPALGAQHAALARTPRYVVDRMRDASWILEPQRRPDAWVAFSRHGGEPTALAALRALSDPDDRVAVARAAVAAVAAAPAGDREARLADALEVLLEVPTSAAGGLLADAHAAVLGVPEPARAVFYADALVVAGHHGAAALAPTILRALLGALRAAPAAELDRVLQRSLRALRRLGLRAELAALLAGAEAAAPSRGPDGVRCRLALAAGAAYLGDIARARPALVEARAALGAAPDVATRIELTRALALGTAQLPLPEALAGIAELAGQLKDITDGLSTNSHFCLSVIHFVESLVLGVTSDELALGEVGRRFVADDEHLIRRRLHRDLGGLP